jgi:error-prone DNA polymerase
VNHSRAGASLEFDHDCTATNDRSGPALRLGIGSVRGIGDEMAERIARDQPWKGGEDLVRRAGVNRTQLELLAAAGALDPPKASPMPEETSAPSVAQEESPSVIRRRLLWAAGAAAQSTPDRLPGIVVGIEAPSLPTPTALDGVADDLWALGMAPEQTAMALVRPHLDELGVVRAADLFAGRDGERIVVSGVVTHRQHPETARGAVFVNLEDETGHVNVVFSKGAWVRWRHVARHAPVLLIRGRLELAQDVASLTAERVEAFNLGAPVPASRDFR